MRSPQTLLLALLLAGCAAKSPTSLEPPSVENPAHAQITAQREFRMLGGGSGQIHQLFDLGTAIEFDAEVPAEPRANNGRNVYKLLDRITLEIFERVKLRAVFAKFDGASGEPPVFARIDKNTRVHERVDESLLGLPLVAQLNAHSGEFEVNPRYLRDYRGKLERVRIRQLYDSRNDVLWRTMKRDSGSCGPISDPDGYFREVREIFTRDFGADGIRLNLDRTYYAYGESCGLVAAFDFEWNARHIGSFPGFDPMTWERPPGRLGLVGIIGYQHVYANEIDVDAGRQYGGVYDPNDYVFTVEPLQ